MLDKLAGIEARYVEIEQAMTDPAVIADYERVAELAQERANLGDIVGAYREYKRVIEELEAAEALLEAEEDPDLRELAQEEIDALAARRDMLEPELRQLLLPQDPRDAKNVIVEIRAGTGGDEAGIFAADLFRLYTRYAEARNWKVEVMSAHETGVNGFKEIIFQIKGKGAYSRLKYESGVHRVQRVPVTESAGRIHTSTATVAVLAEMDEVDIEIDANDLRIDVYRSRGAGGQSVNTTDSAVRITHEPTGIVVACQDERSQLQNRAKALAILRARLYDMEQRRIQEEQDATRRSQVGTGERSEKIRTYNYPQNRVTDHRINMSIYNLPSVMEGNLDEFIDEIAAREQAEKLAAEVSL
ncbi:MAG: peptide chain release factor 1 [Anaerolineae bacterium]|nr:peptide chain release factor 1 [Anaerolineae bacterium]